MSDTITTLWRIFLYILETKNHLNGSIYRAKFGYKFIVTGKVSVYNLLLDNIYNFVFCQTCKLHPSPKSKRLKEGQDSLSVKQNLSEKE